MIEVPFNTKMVSDVIQSCPNCNTSNEYTVISGKSDNPHVTKPYVTKSKILI